MESRRRRCYRRSLTWHDLYRSDAQAVYVPVAVSLLFLLYRYAAGRPSTPGAFGPGAGFVDGYAIAVAIQTMLDAVATTPLTRWLGIGDGPIGTAVMLVFVLLGDFRVYLLLFGLLALREGRSWQSALGRSAAWTLIVPLFAYATSHALHAAVTGLHANTLWLVYETSFAVLALALRASLPRLLERGSARYHYLRAVLLYVAIYYALWAGADVLIQIAALDIGWLLRIVPNQLYYAWFAPFVWFRFWRPH